MWLEKRAVPRPLVVEGKALRLSANLDDARAAFQPAVIASGARQSRLDRRIATLLPMTVRGLERVLCEGGKDVGEEQFLVLLLVVDSKFDEFKLGWAEGRERPKDRIIDMRPILADFIERRPAQHSALRPRMPRALALIIAVEEIGIGFVEEPIAAHPVPENEGFEE